MKDLKQLNDTNLTKIKISETEKEYLKVEKGNIIIDSFTIVNVGTKPLMLKGVNAQCDCTTLEYLKNKTVSPADSLVIRYQIETSAMDKGYNKETLMLLAIFSLTIKILMLLFTSTNKKARLLKTSLCLSITCLNTDGIYFKFNYAGRSLYLSYFTFGFTQ